MDEIKANDYNLNITRYITSVDDGDENVDLKISKREIDKLEIDRGKLKSDIDEIFKRIRI